MRTAAVLCAVFIWSLAAGTVAPTLLDSLALDDRRTALDVDISREMIAGTGSNVRR